MSYRCTASTPGASLEEMRAVGKRITADMLALPYVATVSQQIGRAELGEDTSGPHQSEFQVELKPDADIDQTRSRGCARARSWPIIRACRRKS